MALSPPIAHPQNRTVGVAICSLDQIRFALQLSQSAPRPSPNDFQLALDESIALKASIEIDSEFARDLALRVFDVAARTATIYS
jgi:hypothetical protein